AMPCCCDWISHLARDHAGRLAGVARREGLPPADALDIVQDAFHALLERPDAAALRERPTDAARLLSVLVRNAARNPPPRRPPRARPRVEVAGVALPADAPAPDDALDAAAAAARLGGCMAELGDVHRHVVTLRVLEELSSEDAARALGVSANHVAVLLYR